MYYGMAYFPDVDPEGIARLRRKYDPTVDLIAPHLTVMFLVPESVGEGPLVQHLEDVLKRWRPFPIRLHGFRKSWDHWLFLVLKEGNDEVIKLYQDVYTGILAEHRRDDIEFIPHVALGLFIKQTGDYDFKGPRSLDLDERGYQEALREAEALELDHRCVLDKLHLVKFTDDISRVVWTREMPLGGRDSC